MAEYRRFISYMYLYENGRKAGNSGFVRVESRNGQCRLHMHMTGMYGPGDAAYDVYMLIRETGGYIGISMGHLIIQGQIGERDVLTDSNHLFGTGYALDRVSGMVVLVSDGRVYGTRWDDEPLETECFSGREQLGDNLMLFYASGISERDIEAMTGRVAAVPVQETELHVEMLTEASAEEQESSEQESLEQASSMQESLEQEPPMQKSLVQESPVQEFPEMMTVSDGLVAYDVKPEVSDSDNVSESRDASGRETASLSAYDMVLQKYPQMYPFDDDSMEICVRLDLQDIGMLPMHCWLYGSNSFLLHGYYCYRHLLLARMQTVDVEEGKSVHKTVYILGVPGVRQHRDEYMASMFGFCNFKPVSRENTGRGAYGYWYVELNQNK